MKLRNKAVLGALALALAFILDDFANRAIRLIHYAPLDSFFHWISVSLFTVFMLMLLTSLALYEGKKKDWIVPMWLSAAFAAMLVQVLKLIFMRERPDGFVMTMLWIRDFSFPSAHAAICFALVPILDREFPRLSVFWISFASLVALSRLYMGVHYLSDIVAGAAIGYLIGMAVIYLVRWKHGKARV